MSFKWTMPGLILLGVASLLRAEDKRDADQFQTEIEVGGQTLTPYQTALFFYKTGKYDAALTAADAAEKAKPGDVATEILKARILTEQGDFAGAKRVLEGLNGNPGLTPEVGNDRTLAFGDLCLRERSFDEATKFYESLLSRKPGDTDLLLKIIYARIGASDLVTAGKYASQLKPFDHGSDPLDPKHPGNPSYYFAKAALAQATGRTAEAEDDIQTARTLYGITITTRYLKTYLEVFSSSAKSSTSSILTPPPATNAAPGSPNP